VQFIFQKSGVGQHKSEWWVNMFRNLQFVRHAKKYTDQRFDAELRGGRYSHPVVAGDVDGLQIQTIARLNNSGADVFFKGWNVTDMKIDTRLEWKKEVVQLNK
jgi:hypothetical protein